eukprot:1252760-Rhodomonas_salina.4
MCSEYIVCCPVEPSHHQPRQHHDSINTLLGGCANRKTQAVCVSGLKWKQVLRDTLVRNRREERHGLCPLNQKQMQALVSLRPRTVPSTTLMQQNARRRNAQMGNANLASPAQDVERKRVVISRDLCAEPCLLRPFQDPHQPDPIQIQVRVARCQSGGLSLQPAKGWWTRIHTADAGGGSELGSDQSKMACNDLEEGG